MKIGIIVDGQAEYRSLQGICQRVDTDYTVLKPLYADMQPNAVPAKIVRSAQTHLQIFAAKKVDRVIICLDQENRAACTPAWARILERAFAASRARTGINEIIVVLKVRMYENWLVSDVNALKTLGARFLITAAHEKQIVPNRADTANATQILKDAAQKVAYHKVRDAVSVGRVFDPYRGAANSRSFRKFLRMIGCKRYSDQSREPG